MVREEPTNTRTAGIDTNITTQLWLRCYQNSVSHVGNVGYSSNCKIFRGELLLLIAKYTLPSFSGKIYSTSVFEVLYIHDHLANQWNRITTKIFDMFRVITLKKQKFSQSDLDLIRQFSKKLQSDPVLIRPKLASVLVQSDPVLVRAYLC